MRVKVTFFYEAQDPDPADRTGLSEHEFNELTERLMEAGAEDITVEKTHESQTGTPAQERS